jgi:hypothetical protein
VLQGFGGKPNKKSVIGIPSIDWRIILKWMFRKWDWGFGLMLLGRG